MKKLAHLGKYAPGLGELASPSAHIRPRGFLKSSCLTCACVYNSLRTNLCERVAIGMMSAINNDNKFEFHIQSNA